MATIAPGRIDVSNLDYLAIEREAGRLRAELLGQFFVNLRTWLARHVFDVDWSATVEPLYAMSDRELADIGLSRGDIDSIANGTYQDSHGRMVPPPPRTKDQHAL